MTDQLLSLALEVGAHISPAGFVEFTEHDDLTAFAERIRQDERERCAKLCDEDAAEFGHPMKRAGAQACAIRLRAIRSSGTSGRKSDE
jgi:hypothetical protein